MFWNPQRSGVNLQYLILNQINDSVQFQYFNLSLITERQLCSLEVMLKLSQKRDHPCIFQNPSTIMNLGCMRKTEMDNHVSWKEVLKTEWSSRRRLKLFSTQWKDVKTGNLKLTKIENLNLKVHSNLYKCIYTFNLSVHPKYTWGEFYRNKIPICIPLSFIKYMWKKHQPAPRTVPVYY